MSSSSDKAVQREGKAPADPPSDAETVTTADANKTTTKTKATKNINGSRMSQEQIDSLIRYKPFYFPEDSIPKVSKDMLARANLADKGSLPVPLDKLDDYIAKIFRRVNESEARLMRERDRIVNEYYTQKYFEEVSNGTPATLPAGRRRFRPGVTKQAAGKTKKLN